MWDGFVTIGRGGLWLALISIILLVFTAGFLSAQAYAMIKRPAVMPQPRCLRLHCDDEKQLASWLRQRDYSLITNEVAAEHGLLPGQSARGESAGRHSKTDLLTPPPLWWQRAENGDLTPGPSHPGWPTEEPR